MKVKYLDLETGRIAEDNGISRACLTEGNWSCDCNRAIPFGGAYDNGKCDGCKRYIVVGVEQEMADASFEPFDAEAVIKEANREYYMRLKESVGHRPKNTVTIKMLPWTCGNCGKAEVQNLRVYKDGPSFIATCDSCGSEWVS